MAGTSNSVVSLLEPFISRPQLLVKLLEKTQELLKTRDESTAINEEIISSIRTIVDLFSSLSKTITEQKDILAVEIIRNVCGEYVVGTGYRDNTQEISIATSLGELFTRVAEHISAKEENEDMLAVKEVIDTTLERLSGREDVLDEHFHTSAILFLSVPFNSPVLSKILLQYPNYGGQILTSLLLALRHGSIEIAYSISTRLLPLLIAASPSPSELAKEVWQFVCSVWAGHVSVDMGRVDLSLMLLCCLHRVYVNPSSKDSSKDQITTTSDVILVDLRLKKTFWEIVQYSLTDDANPLSRKKAMFLLLKALSSVNMLPIDGQNKDASEVGVVSSGRSEGGVFWWGCGSDKELTEAGAAWGGTILLLETLEEKQVHIVKPVIVKHLKPLLSATAKYVDGLSMLHLSWIGVILTRVFSHDAKTVVRLGITTCLQIDLCYSPLMIKENWKLIFDPLMSILREAYVFAREDHITCCSPVCPVIAQLLVDFVQQMVNQLPVDKKEPFFSYLLNLIHSKNVPDIPMVFISHALSCVSAPSLCLISSTSLHALRSLVQAALSTHVVKLRAATQCFLLRYFCNNCRSDLGLLEFFQTLGCFSSCESLVFGSSAWTMATDSLIRLVDDFDGEVIPFQFLQTSISMLTSQTHPDSQTQSHSQIQFNSTILGRAILITLTASLRALPSGKKSFTIQDKSLKEMTSLLFYPIMETIVGARTRAYINHTHLVKSIDLLTSILQLVIDGQDLLLNDNDEAAASIYKDISQLLYEVLLPWLPDAFQYLADIALRGLELNDSGDQVVSLTHIQLCLNCMSNVYHLVYRIRGLLVLNEPLQEFNLYSTANKALKVLLTIEQPTVQLTPAILGSVCALEWVCGLVQRNENETSSISSEFVLLMAQLPVVNFTKPANISSMAACSQRDEESVQSSINNDHAVQYGPIVNHCLMAYWKCLLYSLNTTSPSTDSNKCSLIRIGSGNPEALATACMDYIDVVTGDFATPLYCLAVIVPKLPVPLIVSTITSIWPLIKGIGRDLKLLLDSLAAFFHVVFNLDLMLSEEDVILELHRSIITDVVDMAEGKVGVFNHLIGHFSNQWQKFLANGGSGMLQSVVTSISNRKLVLLEGCGFGPVYKKNLRVVDDVEAFVRLQGRNCSSNSIRLGQAVTDGGVRVQVLCLLLELEESLQTSAINSIDGHLLSEIAVDIISMLQKLSIERQRYYCNSFTHRYRMRLVQLLLAIHPFMNKEVAKEVVMAMWVCLEYDNQLSIRYGMEWLIVLLYSRYSDMWEQSLVPQMELDTGRRLSRLCSVFTVAMLYGKCLDSSIDSKVKYYSKMLPLLFQWSMCHHFIVRLYAVGSVVEMWNDGGSDMLAKLPEFSLFPDFINFINKYSDIAKSKKLEHNILFSNFHPLKDFSLQTIYHILPALSGITHEEWITLDSLKTYFTAEYSTHLLPLACSNEGLITQLEAMASSTHSSSTGDPASEQNQPDQQPNIQLFDPNEVNNVDVDGGDVQKKITPWSNSMVELFPAGIHSVDKNQCKETSSSGLIMVASLLLKPPNLGGLCRTCEIFGVSEIVFSCRNVVDEKEFKSLSVTAENWMNITEVKPAHLADYLLAMKKNRYSIIGIEQTAHSKNLKLFKFPSKTVLLLGNERRGIPVELIHLLDDAVEIPQLGTIRSLNAHVSGALVVWEYSKQHLPL